MNIDSYLELAIRKKARCWTCGEEVCLSDIRHYDHPDGWPVDGFKEKQWLYFECHKPSCGYQTSFAKLGIPKNASQAEVVVVPRKTATRPDFFAALMQFQYGFGGESSEGFDKMQKIIEEESTGDANGE